MDDVEASDSIEGASLDDSSSDSQSQISTNASSTTRWLSDRFHFTAEPSDAEEDVFDVNQWPTFAHIATSIGINKPRFLYSSPRPRLLSLSKPHKETLDYPSEEQEPFRNDIEMEESEKMPFTTEPQTESLIQDIVMEEVSCEEQMVGDNLYGTIEPRSPSSSSELGRMNGATHEIHAEHAKGQSHKNTISGSGPIKTKGKKTEGMGNLKPFRRMIQSATKKAPAAPGNNQTEEDADDRDGVARFAPITLQEKRRRQAKRAEQLKFWRVREEREAREARRANRRDLLDGRLNSNTKHSANANGDSSTTTPRKVVKFNLKRNRVIQFDDREANDAAA